jgi:hypothetical protein
MNIFHTLLYNQNSIKTRYSIFQNPNPDNTAYIRFLNRFIVQSSNSNNDDKMKKINIFCLIQIRQHDTLKPRVSLLANTLTATG